MSNAAIRMEQLMLPTYPEPGKEEMPLFSEHRVHQRSTGRPYPNKVTLESPGFKQSSCFSLPSS